MNAKVPHRPPGTLHRTEGDLLFWEQPLFRIHRTQGAHVLPWNEFRTFGPIPRGRYDPHPKPTADYPNRGVMYAATDVPTALAEMFQTTREITTGQGAPQLTAWTPLRQLTLLNLCEDWALKNQAAHSLAHGPRAVCRAWSRAIFAEWDDLDGLWAPSTMSGRPIVALYERARSAIPHAPSFSRPLSYPVVRTLVEHYAAQIAYAVR